MVYTKIKKLGIARAIGSKFFLGGEREMLDRIEISGFEIISTNEQTGVSAVKTKFKVNKINPNTSPTAQAEITAKISDKTTFIYDLIKHTVDAVAEEPASSWIQDPVFQSPPSTTKDPITGEKVPSIFSTHDPNDAGFSLPEDPPTASQTCDGDSYYYFEGGNIFNDDLGETIYESPGCKMKICTCDYGTGAEGSGCSTHATANCASCNSGYFLSFTTTTSEDTGSTTTEQIASCKTPTELAPVGQDGQPVPLTAIQAAYTSQENLPSGTTGA